MDDILIVDDNSRIRNLVAEILHDKDYSIRQASSGSECLEEFKKTKPCMILLDIRLQDPRMDGLQVLQTIRKVDAATPIIIMSAHGNIEIAVKAMRLGAFDYIEKPIRVDRLLSVVRNAMELVLLRRQVKVLRISQSNPKLLIGSSRVFKKYKSLLDQMSKINARVLLSGPSGSGKETAARYIHAQSHLAKGPFLTANIPTMDPEKIESILFGTTSDNGQRISGLIELAHGGTLYLKEVCALPIDLQQKLLGVIVKNQIINEGGIEILKVEIRFLSATSRDIEREIESGQLLPSLQERLATYRIEVPPLEANRSDIPELAASFLYLFHKTQGWPLRELSKEAESFLVSSEWPGNIRQLKNIIERILITGKSDEPITLDEVVSSSAEVNSNTVSAFSGSYLSLPLREARVIFEREYISAQINQFGGNISKAAQFIGMERAALHRKLKSLGIVTRNISGSRVAGFEEDMKHRGLNN
ncbi:MAG: sigma-54 dependent transcriptional regulator [Rhodobacteraceae bacterium]|nr:sigma-54 dependent transcriptional regulator [Paracoccaceae bacterium]MCY4251348.1 sigma-54 dependent transcriptional regulator [Paracoccaceae bacterium]